MLIGYGVTAFVLYAVASYGVKVGRMYWGG
jgi:hypothetical protein